MGFNLGAAFKSLISPNPKDRLPGGAVRAGFDQPLNGRSALDPSGQLLQRPPDPRAQTAVTPYVSHLSAGAQAIKDQMAARRNARMNSGTSPQLANNGFAGAITQAVRTAIPSPSQGMSPAPNLRLAGQGQAQGVIPRASDPNIIPRVSDTSGYGLGDGYADGGVVKRKGQKQASSSKVFNRKPNGKPY